MIQSKLFILNQEIELLWTEMEYDREIRPNGKPDRHVLGGQITVCFVATNASNEILRWMTKPSLDETLREADKMEKGKVCFYSDGFDYPPTKTYEFNDSFPIFFNEVFDANGEIPFLTVITISPAIQNYGAELIKPWNVSYIPPSEDAPFQAQEIEDTQPQIVETYFEDTDGKKVRELRIGTEVYLVIKSKNVTGKTVNVDLSDKKNDFIYNGEHLENDLLKDLSINSDLQKEKLKVIAQHHE